MCEVQFELAIRVGPNPNCAVVGTSGNHLFLNADVETKYGFAMETWYKIFKLVNFVGSFEVYLDLDDLVGVSCK